MTSRQPTQTEITLLLNLIEQQGSALRDVREAVESGHQRSSESRGKLHERIDEVSARLGKIEASIEILGAVDGQVRNEVQGLARTVEKNREDAVPAMEAWADFGAVMRTGRRISWVFGVAGITTVGGLIGFFTGAFETLGAWLKALR